MPPRRTARPAGRTPTANGVPNVIVQRLPVYVRVLSQMESRGIEITSSDQLGESLGMTPAQIRKDLSYFGRFGRQGRGYNVHHLATQLRRILRLDLTWDTALVGVGRLGRAVAAYPGFAPQGIRIAAAFDVDPAIIGQKVADLTVQPLSTLPATVRSRGIKVAIVTVPAQHAQEVIDTLVDAGIRALLNYAPVTPRVPPGVRLHSVDPVLALQSMTYYLQR
ncbi:MAG: redox-sensing transcriptional repressor Rex [Gemmatimonadetes bacterium]|nr:redox-sensing transcriptional repressor Rex [Gemmatimonadota bacterium]